MIKSIRKIPAAQWKDYFILAARILLGWTFLRYGYSKLAEGQFGITPEELTAPLEEVSMFRLSWYLFDQQPFKAFIGISQLICGSLLIINRTVLLGAFLFLPIAITILIIDLSFMPPVLAEGFAWRLSFYLLLDLLILWHYSERMKIIWDTVWKKMSTKFSYPLWAYLLLPLVAILIEIAGILPRVFFKAFTKPEEFRQALEQLLRLFN